MDNQTPSMEAEAEAIKEAYAALNRNDIDGFVKNFDPQIERIEFEGSSATFRGFDAVREHVSQGRSTWAEGGCEPERFVVAGDKIVVVIQVRVRLKDHTDWIDGRTVDVYTVRSGKAIPFARSPANSRPSNGRELR